MVIAFAHDAMGRRIDPSWWTHSDISRSNQCSTTGMVHIKEPLLLVGKSSPCGGSGFPLSRYLNGPLPYVRRHITVTKCVECVVK